MGCLSPFSAPSSAAALRLALLATQIASSSVAAEDPGDSLTNNLFTDIAPLLSLFGERVAQQFLATSMGKADNIIFAIAPLGIITAIVSAIRCSGTAGLKSLVGRSREGRGTVEAELLSSTSIDVVELWNGSGIVRVLGRANIMQVVYVTPGAAASGDIGPPGSQISGTESTPLAESDERKIEVYDFDGAATKGILVNQRSSTAMNGPFVDRLRGLIWRYRKPSNSITAADDIVHDHSVPNIALNVSAFQTSDAESWTVAVVGALLQLTVVVFAGLTVFLDKWKVHFQKDRRIVYPYAFWVFVPGLVTLMLGMFLCARIVDKNTTEEEWGIERSKGQNFNLAWLQKGGTVGDQLFDSYIIQPHNTKIASRKKSRWPALEKLCRVWPTRPVRAPTVITSRRSATAAKGQSLLTALATAISLVGYVLYFLGLRFLHFSVTLFQLALTLAMVFLRAWIRRNMVRKPQHQKVPESFELESMAKLICRCKLWNVVSRFSDDGSDKTKHRAALEVLEARQKLGELSGWPGACDDVAAEVTGALELAMNFVFLEPGFVLKEDWSSRADFEWKLLVEIGLELDGGKLEKRLEEITVKLSRCKLEGGDWGRWTTQTDIKSILGLWIMTFESSNQSAFRPMKRYQTLRVYGYYRVATRLIFEKWVRRQQPTIELLERDGIWDRNPAQFTVGLPFAIGHGTENWVGVLSSTPVNRACGQLIFNEFLSALANDVIKTTNFCIQNKNANFSIPELRNFVDDLTQTGLFNSEEAYLGITDALIGAQKLMIADISCIDLNFIKSTLPVSNTSKSLTTPYGTEPLKTSLWFSYLIETVSSFYEFGEKWDRTIDTDLSDRLSGGLVHKELLRDRLSLLKVRRTVSKYQTNSATNVDTPDRTLAEATRDWDGKIRDRGQETPKEILQRIERQSQELLKLAADTGKLSVIDELIHDLSRIDIDAIDSGGRTALIVASQSGHAAAVGVLLKMGANINHQDKARGRTALHYAAENDNEHVAITLLLRNEAKHRLFDQDNCTPWDLATRTTHSKVLPVLQFYCSTGNDTPCKTDNDIPYKAWSQFHWCAWLGRCSAELLPFVGSGGVEHATGQEAIGVAALNEGYDMIRWLSNALKREDKGDANQHSESRLSESMIGDVALVARLLDRGASLQAQGADRRTPLHWAASGGYTATAVLLLGRGADVEAKDSSHRTPLHWAAKGDHTAAAALLLGCRASVRAQCLGGKTPLHWAAEGACTATATLLLDCGADVEAKDSNRCTPLHWAAKGDHTTMVALLFGRRASVRAQSLDGRTPLHWAAEGGYATTAALLLHCGADVRAEDSSGMTPLRLAAERHTTATLLSYSADVQARGQNRWTLLHWAAEGGHTTTAALLLDLGADVKAKDSHGKTPLHLAAERGHRETAALFLNCGADVRARDSRGRTSLHCTTEGGYKATAVLLLDCGAEVEAKDSHGRTPLQYAAERGSRAIAALLLDHGADVEAKDPHGRTPLHWAAGRGHRETAALFLDRGADVQSQDRRGRTPLHWIVEGGHELTATLLLDRGADVKAKDSRGRAPLHRAAERGLTATAALLLDRGADVQVQDPYGWTPLRLAVEGGDTAMAALLFDRGADVKAKDSHGMTPLHWAAEGGHGTTAALLLDRGAGVQAQDSNRRTPLHCAASKGHTATVTLLLDRGADVQAKDSHGWTPLRLAAEGGHIATAALLLDCGADVKAKDSRGRTPLHRAAEEGYTKRATLLLNYGADVEAKDSRGRTPLHWAAEGGHVTTAALLLDCGAEIQAQDSHDRTPLHCAAGRGSMATVTLLLDRGADVQAQDSYGCTPLHWAAYGCYGSTTALLLNHGADIEAQGTGGGTPLHWAAKGGSTATSALLLSHGANVQAQDLSGRTPLHWATDGGSRAIVTMLLDRGANPEAQNSDDKVPVPLLRDGKVSS